jgi:hypothetical protein
MRQQGIQNPRAVPRAEVDAYLDVLRLGDGGGAFLKIMRRFERTREKRDLYIGVLGDGRYPVQVVWGSNDPALKLAVEGRAARRAAGVEEIHAVAAKHFLQEDQAPAVAELIARLAMALRPAGGFPLCEQRDLHRATRVREAVWSDRNHFFPPSARLPGPAGLRAARSRR